MSAKVAILGKQNPRVLRQAAADMLKENGFEAELLDMPPGMRRISWIRSAGMTR